MKPFNYLAINSMSKIYRFKTKFISFLSRHKFKLISFLLFLVFLTILGYLSLFLYNNVYKQKPFESSLLQKHQSTINTTLFNQVYKKLEERSANITQVEVRNIFLPY